MTLGEATRPRTTPKRPATSPQAPEKPACCSTPDSPACSRKQPARRRSERDGRSPTAGGPPSPPPIRTRTRLATLLRMEDERLTLRTDQPLAPDWIPPEVDTTKAHPARIYEYLLGGKHYFEIDREAAEIALTHV